MTTVTPLLPPRRLGCRSALLALALIPFAPGIGSAATINVTTAAQFTSALSAVQPGDTIALSGTITSSAKFTTTRDGTAAAPITITGGGTAIISSTASYGVEILHDYYRLSGFQIQGSPGKGVVIDNANHGVVDNVHCMDIDQEAFKIRNQSQYWLFTFCSARRTGTSGDFGEGFYVGQASSNWIGGVPDASGYVTFFNCYTTDTVNDGWDIKEGAHHVKMVNCTADFSGTVEPATNAAHGSAGFYLRADYLQVIKSSVRNLNNSDWAYRISNQTVNSIDYGSTGNEIKQSNVISGNVALIYAESGTNARVYTDCVAGPGGLIHSSSSSVSQPSPGTFAEITWTGEGGGIYGNLDSDVGADDPLGAPPPAQVAAPSFSPAGGTYTSAQSVTITTTTSGATIRYTTDGSNPTATTGTVYSSPVSISVTTTLKAIAYKSGMTDSAVTSATYTISAPSQVAAPSFSPGGGTYTSAQSVTISSTTSGASIRYTIDGSTPTATTGTLYSAPVTISATTTLKAIAYKSGLTDSAVTSATYTINTGGGSPGSQNIFVAASSDDAKERTDTSSGTMNLTSSLPFGNSGSTYIVGVRFTGANIPAGATIVSATIQFTAHAADSVATSLTVRGEKSTNAATFITTGHNITNRTFTTASVGWNVPTWANNERGTPEKTPELKTLVQEIVNQGGWVAGRPLVFTFAGTGDRAAKAFDSGAANAATLHIEWQ